MVWSFHGTRRGRRMDSCRSVIRSGCDDHQYEDPTPSHAAYAWSKNSRYYHYSTCDWVNRINAENLVRGTAPPEHKDLHPDCPTHR